MAKKLTSTQKVQRALRALDNAVQEWYQENNPNNRVHYASAHIRDYPEDNLHASRCTLHADETGDNYIDITSSKCSEELR